MSDGYMEYATAPIWNIASWIVVEAPIEFKGVMYYNDEAAQKEIDAHYADTPLNQRDDEKLKTKTFFLIEGEI